MKKSRPMTLTCSISSVRLPDGDLSNLHNPVFWEDNRAFVEEYLKRIQPYQTAFGAQMNFNYCLTE